MHPIALAALLAVAAESPRAGELLLLGAFHGDEVQSRSGESWLCLMSDRDGEELRPCTIEVEQVYDPVVEDDTGKEVSLRGGGEALLLVRNVPALRPGPVRTYFLGRLLMTPDMNLSVGSDDSLQLGLWKDKGSHSLRLWDGKINQTLGKGPYVVDRNPYLLWAGDLDRDGKLDLLLDVATHYNVSELALFLSSLAGPGELVGNAGLLRYVGC